MRACACQLARPHRPLCIDAASVCVRLSPFKFIQVAASQATSVRKLNLRWRAHALWSGLVCARAVWSARARALSHRVQARCGTHRRRHTREHHSADEGGGDGDGDGDGGGRNDGEEGKKGVAHQEVGPESTTFAGPALHAVNAAVTMTAMAMARWRRDTYRAKSESGRVVDRDEKDTWNGRKVARSVAEEKGPFLIEAATVAAVAAAAAAQRVSDGKGEEGAAGGDEDERGEAVEEAAAVGVDASLSSVLLAFEFV
eukprot:6195323-Pleurochrysis_carterae.AAC.2